MIELCGAQAILNILSYKFEWYALIVSESRWISPDFLKILDFLY